jgi:hypothetical protein
MMFSPQYTAMRVCTVIAENNFITQRAHGGNSGAPVIGEYSVKGKTEYAYTGVVFAWSILEKTWCIGPRTAYNFLQSLE